MFQDVEAIPPGVDFRQHFHTQLDQCQVVLVVIGPGWLTIKDDLGTRRLDQESDMVRLEIEVALQRKIPLIPLLVDNATMPSHEQLPKTIQAFAFQQWSADSRQSGLSTGHESPHPSAGAIFAIILLLRIESIAQRRRH